MTHNSCSMRFLLVAHYTRAPIHDTVSQHNHVLRHALFRVADQSANAPLTTPPSSMQHHSTITDTLEHPFGVAAKRIKPHPGSSPYLSPTFHRWTAPRALDPVAPPCTARTCISDIRENYVQYFFLFF
jgi:hypothetical protein